MPRVGPGEERFFDRAAFAGQGVVDFVRFYLQTVVLRFWEVVPEFAGVALA